MKPAETWNLYFTVKVDERNRIQIPKDVADRAELIHQLKLSQTEHQERFEQLIQLLIFSSQKTDSQSKAG